MRSFYKRCACLLALLLCFVALASCAKPAAPQEPYLVEIVLETPPDKTAYEEGEVFDNSGMVIQAVYSSGATLSNIGYDFSPNAPLTVADTSITVTHGGKSIEVPITVAPKLSEIYVSQMPTRTDYMEGELFSPVGMVVMARYSDDSTQEVSDYTYTPNDALAVSHKTISIAYMDKTASVPITVAPAATGIVIVSPPTKTNYVEGTTFDPSGMVVRMQYSDGTSETVTGYDYSPKSELTKQQNAITVTYQGFMATQPIVVTTATLQGLSITSPPTRTSYVEGELFQKAGMVVTATYSNGKAVAVTDYDYNPKTALKTTNTSVSVTYLGFTAIQPISVSAFVVTVKSLAVTTAPTRTTYVEGELFQKAGMVVTATYTDGNKVVVSDYDYAPKTALDTASPSVTISYDGISTSLPLTVQPKKYSRGLCYNFTNSTGSSASDMDLMMGGQNGIEWFYNWGIVPADAAASNAKARNLDYFPMAWRSSWTEAQLRAYKASRPELEYVLAYNEPNLVGQAEITPSEAGAMWPRLKAIAKELGLKIVSPAMNGGTLAGYTGSDGAIRWLDEFFAHPNVSIDDIYAISIHCYVDWPSAFKNFVEKFKKYQKPIWVTEFCAWENQNNNITNNQWEWQARLMSQAITFMELDPQVERYAWYIAKAPDGKNAFPYNKLMTGTGATSTLTPLGTVYTNMSVCDKRVYVPVGTKIDAAQYTDCNISEWIGKSGFAETARTRPSTDTDGVLELHHFTQNEWVEYQVQVLQTKSHTLNLRFKTAASTNLSITVDGSNAKTTTLNNSSWSNASVSLGTLQAGLHTIRIKVTNSSGECSLNWLELA